MGFFDLFSSSPAKKVERAKKVMLNEHQQAQIRQESLLSLVEIGTPEAVSALIERLGVNFRDTIRNEQEKGWVHQFLVDQFKDVSETPLKDFIQTGENVSSAILALKELISDEELTDFLIETLRRYDPKDHRTIEVRLQLIDALDEQEGPVLEAVLPYVLDHDDQIRIKAINLVEDRVKGVDGDHSDVIKTCLLYTSPSPRDVEESRMPSSA